MASRSPVPSPDDDDATPAPVPARLAAAMAYAGDRGVRLDLVDVVAGVLAQDLALDPRDGDVRRLAERIMAAVAASSRPALVRAMRANPEAWADRIVSGILGAALDPPGRG